MHSGSETRNKESFMSALSENKPQSFMKMLTQAMPMPLTKEFSFAHQGSVGVISGIPSCSTQNKLDSGIFHGNPILNHSQVLT